MQHSLSAYLLVPLLLLLSACAAVDPAIDYAAEERAIREIVDRWNQAMDAGDVEAILPFYAVDGYMAPPNAERVKGETGLRAAWSAMLGLPQLDIEIEPVEIRIARAGDMALETGDYRMAFQVGEQPVQDHGKYVVVWTKEDGVWKVAADIFNTSVPQ